VTTALVSGALNHKRDRELVRQLMDWRNMAEDFNRRLDLTELQLCTVDIVDARDLALLREVVRRPDGHFALAGEQLERLRAALDAHSTALHAWGLIGDLVVDPLRRAANRLQRGALPGKDSERAAQPPPLPAE
jgi:hypothetical protein